MAWTIILSAASGSRKWRPPTSFWSGPTSSATCTARAQPTPRHCSQAGCDVVLVIDVQGARKVRQRGIETTAIFVMPPSFAVLEQRLRSRSKDSEAAIQRRLQVAREEVDSFAEYDFVVVNDDVTAALERLQSILLAQRARLRSMRYEAETIVRTFS